MLKLEDSKKRIRDLIRLVPFRSVSFLFLPFLSVSSFALPSESQIGGNAAEFLQQGFGARALGMGEAYGPVAQGADAIYWNPSGLAAAKGPELTYTHSEPLTYFHQDFGAYAQPLSEGTIGVSYTRFYQDSLPLVTNTNQTVGSFSPYSESIAFAIAKSFLIHPGAGAERGKTSRPEPTGLPKGFLYTPGSELTTQTKAPEGPGAELSIGLSAKVIHEQYYDQSASAFAVDGGARFKPAADGSLVISAVFRNLGTQEKFISQSASLPTEIDAGAAYEVPLKVGRLLPAAEVALPYYSNPYVKVGVEYSASVTQSVTAALRTGYESLTVSDLGALSGLTAGLGVRYDRLTVDFGIEPMLVLGENYRISLTIDW